ncbi:MAG: carbohydrate kinase family protein [Nanoarchaeota archaeon]
MVRKKEKQDEKNNSSKTKQSSKTPRNRLAEYITVLKPKSFRVPGKKYKKYDVITFGSATLDVFVDTDNEIIKRKGQTNELLAYPLGSKLLIRKLNFEIGGGGTNTAVSLARFGLATGWAGSIGKCDNSRTIIEILHKEGIDFLGRTGEGVAGYSVILDSVGHDRTILTYKGENDNLVFDGLNKNALRNATWFYFCSLVGKSFEAQKKAARFARENDIKLAFNPSSYQAKLGAKKLSPILRYTDLLVLNLEEAGLLVGHYDDIKETLNKIHETGPHIVIVTDGPNGAYCSDMTNVYKVHAQKIKIIETTGAGDAFASSFLGAFIKTDNIKLSLKLGLVNAQSVIQNKGAKNILLKWKDVLKKHKSKPVKITKI